mmetsp:Transcript_5220/g.11625  ORF Transcript_5220/g.11625 Transcript_5220/m.11625 type:complete len:1001 (-) Transcript_5220:259-3261(-)
MEGRRHLSRSALDPLQSLRSNNAECKRLDAEEQDPLNAWKRWGPYVSERQWGTCREDYGLSGNSWAYLPFSDSHRVAYRWGEDGIAGVSDDQERLCLSLAMWNGKDPILKERLYGLSNPEGNHGEDCKEMYYYLDATPTHSYLKMLYKYPQGPFPYDELRDENGKRGEADEEFEVLDTGIFESDEYFDVFVEYAKDDLDDILMRVTVQNRASTDAELHLLPQLFFRNTWSWGGSEEPPKIVPDGKSGKFLKLQHPKVGAMHLYFEGETQVLFCENETNPNLESAAELSPYRAKEPEESEEEAKADSTEPEVAAKAEAAAAEPASAGPKKAAEAAADEAVTAASTADVVLEEVPEPAVEEPAEPPPPPEPLYQASGRSSSGPFKDAFHRYVILGDSAAAEATSGSKAGLLTKYKVPGGGSVTLRLRLTTASCDDAFKDFDSIFTKRIEEADAFYALVQSELEDAEAQLIQRQALAGMIWTKQFYYNDLHFFFQGDEACQPVSEKRRGIRNGDWDHMLNCDIISMPDKWEFPWYATWDLAFHCLPLALVDPGFAKNQLRLMIDERYMHPNGQLPAFEWNFSDVNPPVHAWATWRVFQMERKMRGGVGDIMFLEEVFQKLLINFTWWVNRKDAEGRNIFQGGFLGLDNIGVFDRGGNLPTGGFINQSDGTSWMAFYSLCMMRIAIELALENKVYESLASKFFEHFLLIAHAMTRLNAGLGLWDEEDEFYYDVLTKPTGERVPLKVRSMVGLIPLFAVEVLEPDVMQKLPRFANHVEWLLDNRPYLRELISHFEVAGEGERKLLSLLRGKRMKALLKRMCDPEEFLSDYGVRALSRYHLENPYVFETEEARYVVKYEPAEASVSIMGGNSNWRGPIWFPMNYLIIESLQKFYQYYGQDYLIEYPSGSGDKVSLLTIAEDISERLIGIFREGSDGIRPALRQHPKSAKDPHFKDYMLFYEHFHGDTGRGVGASHQTGWTGLVAKLIQVRASYNMLSTPTRLISPS